MHAQDHGHDLHHDHVHSHGHGHVHAHAHGHGLAPVSRVEGGVMAASVAMSVLMLGGKLSAYWVSGSVAILSDAAESVIHGVATGFAAYSLWYSRRPADPGHPYGGGKIAYFSAGFEGALIFMASVVIVALAAYELIAGVELASVGLGLIITAALCLVNLLLGLSLVTVGRARHAIILVSNGQHVLSDMWTSLGVVAGVFVVWLTDILWLDPLVAMAVGANIGFTGIRLMRRAVAGLLDMADPKALAAIRECLDASKAEGLIADHHQVRMRQSDNLLWIEAHLLLPGHFSLHEAHERATQAEERIRGLFPHQHVHITTHLEPDLHAEAHPEGHAGLNDPHAPGARA